MVADANHVGFTATAVLLWCEPEVRWELTPVSKGFTRTQGGIQQHRADWSNTLDVSQSFTAIILFYQGVELFAQHINVFLECDQPTIK